jgi:hypothetical protein
MRTHSVLLAVMALLGCSSSSSPADAGSAFDAEVDTSAVRDVGAADEGTPDADPMDAEVDAALPDVGVDAGPLRSCTIEYFMNQGDGCFCMGPVASFGRYLYRQSLGIEVYDVQDPENLVRLDNVEERPSSNGRIAVRGGLLVSSLNFEAEPLRLYSLSNPAVPTEVARFGNTSVRGFTAGEGAIAVIEEGDESTDLVHYRVSREGASETWRTDLSGVPAFPDASLGLLGGDVFVATLANRDPEMTRLQRFDASGLETLTVLRTGNVQLFVGGGELYAIGGEAQLARLDPTTLETAISFGDAVFGETVLVRDDIVLLGGSMTVLERTTLRELPLTVVGGGMAGGFVHAEAGEGDLVFGSSGNGMIPFSLRCE